MGQKGTWTRVPAKATVTSQMAAKHYSIRAHCRSLGVGEAVAQHGRRSRAAARTARFAAMRILHVIRNPGGASAVEFAFVAPILIMLMIGIAKFGLVLNNYLTLTEAVATGARYLALSRDGSSSPYTGTIAQVEGAAFNLSPASLTITTTVNGTACSANATCQTLLTAGTPAMVRATYPCDLSVFGYDFAPSCTLSSSTTDMIQ